MPVRTFVAECAWNGGYISHWGILFWGRTFDGVYVPCIYSHPRWSYCRQFRSLLLGPLSVERGYITLLILQGFEIWDGFHLLSIHLILQGLRVWNGLPLCPLDLTRPWDMDWFSSVLFPLDLARPWDMEWFVSVMHPLTLARPWDMEWFSLMPHPLAMCPLDVARFWNMEWFPYIMFWHVTNMLRLSEAITQVFTKQTYLELCKSKKDSIPFCLGADHLKCLITSCMSSPFLHPVLPVYPQCWSRKQKNQSISSAATKLWRTAFCSEKAQFEGSFLRKTQRPTCCQKIRFVWTVHQRCVFWLLFLMPTQRACCCSLATVSYTHLTLPTRRTV